MHMASRGRCCPFLVIRGRQRQLQGDGIRKEKRVTRPAVGREVRGRASSAALLVGGEIGDQELVDDVSHVTKS